MFGVVGWLVWFSWCGHWLSSTKRSKSKSRSRSVDGSITYQCISIADHTILQTDVTMTVTIKVTKQ